MDLTYEEVESLISQIMLGQKLVSISRDGFSSLLLLKHPTREDLQQSDYVLLKALEFGRKLGMPTIEDMEKQLEKRGIWGQPEQDEIKKLQASLAGQEAVLSKTTRVPMRRDRLVGIIDDLKSQILTIQRRKELFLEHTVERKAEEERLLYLTSRCVFDPETGERLWPTLKSFKAETEVMFRRDVALEFTIFSMGVPTKTLRYLARSSQWAVRYLAAQKQGGKLFKRPIYDYSIDMLHLMHWTAFYQSLHEMMAADRPDPSIIDDDFALDKFMDDYFDRIKKESAAERMKKASGKNATAWNHNELIITKSNPVFEDVDFSKTPAQKAREKGNTSVVEIAEKAKKR